MLNPLMESAHEITEAASHITRGMYEISSIAIRENISLHKQLQTQATTILSLQQSVIRLQQENEELDATIVDLISKKR